MEKNDIKKKELVHETVLLKETVDGLNLKKGDTVFDGTLGGGGHSAYVAEKFGTAVKIIAVDRDSEALQRAEERLKSLKANYSLVLSDYRNIDKALDAVKVEKVQGIILDLGLSSNQLDESGRGFSFKNNEPLYMTFAAPDDKLLLTAKIILNQWAEETLADIIYGYGDERYARRIAKKIIEYRKVKPVEMTWELVDIIGGAVPAVYKRGKIHFATKTFQAIRMAVNDELGALKDGLEKGIKKLSTGGRMSVISFHSGEDRIVKNFFRDLAKEKKVILINKKPIIASEQEIRKNPRARSAKLRIIEKNNKQMSNQKDKRINNCEPLKKWFWSFIMVLIICLFSYGYCVRTAIVNIVERQNMESELSTLDSKVQILEAEYFKAKNSVTPELAQTMGFIDFSSYYPYSREEGNH